MSRPYRFCAPSKLWPILEGLPAECQESLNRFFSLLKNAPWVQGGPHPVAAELVRQHLQKLVPAGGKVVPVTWLETDWATAWGPGARGHIFDL